MQPHQLVAGQRLGPRQQVPGAPVQSGRGTLLLVGECQDPQRQDFVDLRAVEQVAGALGRDLGVINLPSGQPSMRLAGGALHRLEKITPAGMTARLDVTLTDEPPIAQAVVIITAVLARGS